MDYLPRILFRRPRLRYAALVLVFADAVALVAAYMIAFRLRFDTLSYTEIVTGYVDLHAYSIPISLIAYLAVFHAFRLYSYAWRHASLEMVWGVLSASALGCLSTVVVQYVMDGHAFPRSVLLIAYVFTIILVGGVRILLRHLSRIQRYPKAAEPTSAAARAVIIGGGAHGARILRSIHEDPNLRYNVIGFLDDHAERQGIYIGSARVLGSIKMLPALLERKAVDIVIIAMPTAPSEEIRQYVLECRRHKVRVKVIPRVNDFLSGRAHLGLEDFSVEDLLRRTPVCTDMAQVGRYIEGNTVLVTGAGGSIGSELCRQIMRFSPASLVLLGHGENSIFQIHQELIRCYPEMASLIHCTICSVPNDTRLNQVFEQYRPDVVFHAAAHKHVPIMEANIVEAMYNNVIGASNVAEACGRHGVSRMVQISTDKAANPASIMGASKWLCEQVVRAAAGTWPNTTYVTVRFGNVLGSRGSVVPLFRDQIARGGPVTVTHPEMTRYFMTIPEAAQLVLQAGAIGASGDLYLLDMGKPVKILDMARDMIRLSGFEPETDIPIVFTGIRPGEKLHEQLATDGAQIDRCSCPGMFTVMSDNHLTPGKVMDVLDDIRRLISYGDDAEVRDYLARLAPGVKKSAQAQKAPQSHPFQGGVEAGRKGGLDIFD